MTLPHEEWWVKARARRWELVNLRYLREELALRTELAKHGWYEFLEPEEGEMQAIAHKDDLKTYIVGFVAHDGVVFEPGADNEWVKVADYPSFQHFIDALRVNFDELVKVWYP